MLPGLLVIVAVIDAPVLAEQLPAGPQDRVGVDLGRLAGISQGVGVGQGFLGGGVRRPLAEGDGQVVLLSLGQGLGRLEQSPRFLGFQVRRREARPEHFLFRSLAQLQRDG